MEKDQTTQRHLQRMKIYAAGIGKDLGLTKTELAALEAAAVLHDVGKLAIPDHIASKPGPLTPQEHEKVEIHAAIGAGIIERAHFPFEVAPIIRSHHERWDGSGYPDRLCGTAIPLGARILAAVDCLDALTTERSYRPALSLGDAVQYIVTRAGKDFDPEVTASLERKYRRLEAQMMAANPPALDATPPRYLQSIGAARTEMSGLFRLHEDLARALNPQDLGHVLRTSFRELIRYDALAIHMDGGANSKPQFVCGDRSVTRRTSCGNRIS